MPNPSTSYLPIPDSWDEFEKIVRDVYAREWNDPATERHGRTGQPQHGVDVFGRPADLGGELAGIQCKRLEEGTLTLSIIKAEAAKAEGFDPEIKRFTIATTDRRDGALQRAVLKFSRQREKQGKFPVEVVFWDALSNLLANPENQDLIRKYYSGWAEVFSRPDIQVREYVQVAAERDELRGELADERQRQLRDRLDALRATTSDGYVEAARGGVDALVEDLEALRRETEVDWELEGAIYRLAASVYLPAYLGGDADRCDAYLRRAEDASSGEGRERCRLLEALLVYQTRGRSEALPLLDRARSPEVPRFRFSMQLESRDLAGCQATLESEGGAGALVTPEWLQLLALYYAEIGERTKLDTVLGCLLSEAADASDHAVAGHALMDVAYAQYRAFCREHDVCPLIPLDGLGLHELIDPGYRRRAATELARAADMYAGRDCPLEARRCLEAALLLEMDSPGSEMREHLLGRLRASSPEHPLVRILEAAPSGLVGVAPEQVAPLLDDPSVNPNLILIEASGVDDPDGAKRMREMLEGHQARFALDEDLYAEYLYMLFQLHRRSSTEPDLLGWLAQCAPPRTYRHLKPLWYGIHYLAEGKAREAVDNLVPALEGRPDHPELLLVAVGARRLRREVEEAVAHAGKLFRLLPTPATVELYLDCLLAAGRYEEYLGLTQSSDTPGIDEHRLRRGSAYACIRTDRLPEARDHLRWLYENGKADARDLLNLAELERYLGEGGRALAVLLACVDRYPDESLGYTQLAHAYLDADQPDEARRWSARAFKRFEDDPSVAATFYRLSTVTGGEERPEARRAFVELTPGGRFSDSAYLVPQSFDAIVDLFRRRHEFGRQLEQLYRAGKIPSIFMVRLQEGTLFRFHTVAAQTGQARYAAAGDQPPDASWLRENNPKEVVLDYTALLTLWSLFREDWIEVLRRAFERVWIPTSLLTIVDSERDALVFAVQPSRQEARVRLRDIRGRALSKIRLEPAIDTPDGTDRLGPLTETKLSADRALPYLNQYLADDVPHPPLTFGLRLLADVLYGEGRISLEVRDRLAADAKPLAESSPGREDAVRGHLGTGSHIVANVATLEQVALTGGLEGLYAHFGQIHVSEPAWRELEAEIAEYDLNREMAAQLRALRDTLGQGVSSRFVRTGSAPSGLRPFSRRAPDRDGEELTAGYDPRLGSLLGYVDDLLALAHLHRCPIWTDDRWTSKLYEPELEIPAIFGTDQFLEWRRAKEGDDNAWFDRYGSLVGWGYMGLPIHPEYISWLLAQRVRPDAGRFAAALDLYRRHVQEAVESARSDPEFSDDFALGLLGSYAEGVMSTLVACFKSRTSTETGASIFRALDLTRHSPPLVGREPDFYASLLYHSLAGDKSTDASRAMLRVRREAVFGTWFDQVVQESGVSAEELREAWVRLLQVTVELYETAEGEQDRAIAALYAERLLAFTPQHVRDYVGRSWMGDVLAQRMGIRYRVLTTYRGEGAAGSYEVIIPHDRWAGDLREAVVRFLAEETSEPIAVGDLSVRIGWLSPNSIFLRLHIMPAVVDAAATGPADMRLLPVLFAATDPDARARLGFWQQGLRTLEALDLRTDEWRALRGSLASDRAEVIIPAGIRARRLLLSHLLVAQTYFAEAAGTGTDAIERLLPYVVPPVVRGWLDMPPLDWEDSSALKAWASGSTDTPSPDGRHRHAYSLFPDAELWRNTLTDAASDDGSRAALTEELLRWGERTASARVKANVLLAVLQLTRGESDRALADRMERRLHELAAGLTGALDDDGGRTAYWQLEQGLCACLYAAWRGDRSYRAYSSRELAYLASSAAGIIIDALASGDPQPGPDKILRLAALLHTGSRSSWWSIPDTSRQPAGRFKPAWSMQLNYPLAYLVGGLERAGEGSELFAGDNAVRASLLPAAVAQRDAQSKVRSLREERDWLDALLAEDTAAGLAALLGGGEVRSDEERLLYEVCASPEVGDALETARLESVPSADERGLLEVLAACFAPAPVWRKESLAAVEALLSGEGLERLRQSPTVITELTMRLLELLVTSQGIPPRAEARVREVTFGLHGDDGNAGEAIHAQAKALALAASYSLFVDDICVWLGKVVADQDLEVADARRALLPFLDLWHRLPEEAARAIGATVVDASAAGRFSGLWEIGRIRRELARLG